MALDATGPRVREMHAMTRTAMRFKHPLLLSLVTAVVGNGCLTFDQPDGGDVDAGTGGSSGVEGQILVAGAQQAGMSDAERDVRARVAASLGLPARPMPRAVSSITDARPVVEARAAPLHTSKRALEWLPGELIFQIEKGAFTRTELKAVAERMLEEAGEPAHVVRVKACTAGVMCLLGFEHAGKPLSLPATQDLETALHAVRPAGVKVVSTNNLKHALRVPNDEHFALQLWHYEWARLSTAWDITTGDPNMVVAVVDTGLVVTHPDITARIAQGVDMISDPGVAGDGNARDTDPTDVGDQSWGNGQSSWHGSHVAGTIAAVTDNGIGGAGITWQGRIQPIRVLGIGTAGSAFDIISGVFWAAGEVDIDDVPQNTSPSRVINLSLGGPASANEIEVWAENVNILTVANAANYGNPILVTAAGNEDQDVANVTPANIPGVIAVGAHRFDGQRASYSNWGPGITFMAPGGETSLDQNQDGYPDGVLSLFDHTYTFQHGTSMATPHVAGIAALVLAVNPGLTQTTMTELLVQSANTAGQCNEGCGAGYVDATKALLTAGGVALPNPTLAVDRSRLFFPEDVDQATLDIYNIGTGDLTFGITMLGPQSNLFTVSPTSGTVPSQGTLEVTVTLARGNFQSGSANMRILGQGDASGQETYVDLTFTDIPVNAARPVNVVNVGAYTVDATGNYAKKAEVLTRPDDEFEFRIGGLAAGEYFVFAIGDDNNDGLFDPQTDSFGAWPVASNPRALVVEDNKLYTGVNFGLAGGLILNTTGIVGSECQDDADCTFAGDATCLTDWTGGYCTRLCDDGFCGSNGSCEELTCGAEPCFVCLASCATDNQCRTGQGFVCDNFQTCTPDGF